MPQDDNHGPGSVGEASHGPSRPEKGLAARSLDPVFLVLAWVVLIIGVVLWSIKPGAEEEVSSPDQVPKGLLVDSQVEISGQISLGLSRLIPGMQAESQVSPLLQGSPADQISYAIFVGATSTPEYGRQVLEDIVDSNPDDPVVESFAPLVFSAFESAENDEPPSEQTSQVLEERFGWYGELASAMSDPARLQEIANDSGRTAMFLFLFIGVFGIAGMLGFVGLTVLLVLAISNHSLFTIPRPNRHGVYAETFAGWLLLMLLLQLVMGSIAPEGAEIFMSTIAFFASLLVLGWPVIRGIDWLQVRSDIGLKAPHWSDLPTGVASWAMALPFLGIGLAITLALMFIQMALTNEAASPSHPAQQAAVGAGTFQLVQLFILACIAAPIVEEIMFRGVLLTHLCGWSRKWPVVLGLVFAMGLSSFVFAAIHPQGLIFIPPLGGLAIGFCIARLWRASLIPAMVAHGFSNGLVLMLNVLLFAS